MSTTRTLNEADARSLIDEMLRTSGWRLVPSEDLTRNVLKEHPVDLTRAPDQECDPSGVRRGRADYVLLDDANKPIAVIEAKATTVDPLSGKEQAREYAEALGCRLVFLSNGLSHWMWDVAEGNPERVTRFPQSISLVHRASAPPRRDSDALLLAINEDFIVESQEPGYRDSAWWNDATEREERIKERGLAFMRDYQVRAARSVQSSAAKGRRRFLLEMATGTGKTLVAAAVIRLFLSTGLARRVLFLVDRLELEDQANRALTRYFSRDRLVSVFKEQRDGWMHSDIVITTVQSLLVNGKYRDLFSPTDFDMVISDEAHRSISGTARAIFEYFGGYKLGMTATPRDLMRGFAVAGEAINSSFELERRVLRDTYRTFGCETGVATFQYSLVDGVNDGYLVNPTTVDARTDVTTKLLSDSGYHAVFTDSEGEVQEGNFSIHDFEQSFFSEATNETFCNAVLNCGLADPINQDFGKTIIFTVSQAHAERITQKLNEIASARWPQRYRSDFAIQVTSSVKDAQLFARRFANNSLGGQSDSPGYRTSRTRVCVTVGMMTTGYDCPDLLNVGLMRPVFSPSEFVQMKGRGTRLHEFGPGVDKNTFKLLDFFGNIEYFEAKHDYDEALDVAEIGEASTGGDGTERLRQFEYTGPDEVVAVVEQHVGSEGMVVDYMLFERFKEVVRNDTEVAEAVRENDWDRVSSHVQETIFNHPGNAFTPSRLRSVLGLPNDTPLRDLLELALGLIDQIKTTDQRAEEAFDLFLIDHPEIGVELIPDVKQLFKGYVADKDVRAAVATGEIIDLLTNPALPVAVLLKLPTGLTQSVVDWVNSNFNLGD